MNIGRCNFIILVLLFHESHLSTTNRTKVLENLLTVREIIKMGKGLTDIPKGTLEVKIVNLAYNEIAFLDDYVFQNMTLKNIEKLDLHENKIANISNFAFRGLRRLKTVNLSYNKLSNLYSYTFEQNKRLETLDLSGNKIKFFKGVIFLASPSLDTLILNDNAITQVYEFSFVGVKHLSNLMMDDNALLQIHLSSFKALTDIQYLSLANTRVSHLSSAMFNKIPKVINVQNTPLANQFDPPLTRIKQEHMNKLRKIDEFLVN